MQPCRRLASPSAALDFVASRTNGLSPQPARSVRRRYTSSRPASSVPSSVHRCLTIAHKTKSLLPRILPAEGDLTFTSWNDVLGKVPAANAPEGPARVVVYGCDTYAAAAELVEALLTDPFVTPVISPIQQLDGQAQSFESTSAADAADSNVTRVSSAWLQQFTVPVQLTLLPSTNVSPAHKTQLMLSDIPILVLNPITTPITTVLSDPELAPVLHNPNAIVLFTSGSSNKDVLARVKDAILNASSGPTTVSAQVLSADPVLALSALAAVRVDSGSPSTVQRFQDGYTSSRLSSVTQAVSRILGTSASPQSLADARTRTALSVLRASLQAGQNVLCTARDEVQGVRLESRRLDDAIVFATIRAQTAVFGAPPGGTQKDNALDKGLKEGDESLRTTLANLTWYKLPLNVDSISDMMAPAVYKFPWYTSLREHLILNAGHLRAVQEAQSEATELSVSRLPSTSAFRSSLLANALAQTRASPSYAITPQDLLAPLDVTKMNTLRLNERLHRQGQRVVFGGSTGVLASGAVGWAGWAGWLSSGLLGGMEAESAAAVGMVGAVLSARWAVGRWEKAKTGWLDDYGRLKEAMLRDLKGTVDNVVKQKVFALPEQARQALSATAEKRLEEVEELKEELDALVRECDVVEQDTKLS